VSDSSVKTKCRIEVGITRSQSADGQAIHGKPRIPTNLYSHILIFPYSCISVFLYFRISIFPYGIKPECRLLEGHDHDDDIDRSSAVVARGCEINVDSN